MNTDVLFNIAAFSDMDTRRSMGMEPRQLKRNVELDARLQASHAMLKITRNKWTNSHTIYLNDKMRIVVGVGSVEHYYKTFTGRSRDVCQFCTYGTTPYIRSYTYLDTPLDGGNPWVTAYFENGMWKVKQGQSAFGCYPAPSDYPVLAKLGYVVACTT
jgi:hypothetical protein